MHEFPASSFSTSCSTASSSSTGTSVGSSSGSSSAADPGLLRPSVVSLSIRDRSALYAAYMPFLRHGGIFVPGNRACKLGDEVFLLLTLMQDEQRYPIAGKVAWVTPAGAGNHHTQGFGVHFPDDDSGRSLRKRIEELLGTALGSSRSTHTM